MAKTPELVAVKDAVYKLQNFLLEGSSSEEQLFAAGSIMSRGDYDDVVTERSISKICGYPLCGNALPSDRTHKGRYRISLNEHKVYDLNETSLYCSSRCVVNSKTFSTNLQLRRCMALDPAKIDGILRLFGELKLEPEEDVDKLELSKLKIQENEEVRAGEFSMENWAGPSNAIEGYVPKKESVPKIPPPKSKKQGAKPNNYGSVKHNNIINDFDFVSTIITQDEYSITKSASTQKGSTSKSKGQAGKGVDNESEIQGTSTAEKKKASSSLRRKSKGEKNESTQEDIPSTSNTSQVDSKNGLIVGKSAAVLSQNKLKSSLKSTSIEKSSRCVTWADEKDESSESGSLCEIKEIEDAENHAMTSGDAVLKDEERFSSAEAIAMALNQAAEAVASGKSDAMHAVSEAGLVILHPLDKNEEESLEDASELEIDPTAVKWPRKAVIHSTPFDSEDSWFDAPPEEFSLNLSPFATMWGTLFSWITSSSLAYIYGQDESFHEDYLSVNGRCYPQRVDLPDGRSSEIKQTVARCLSRATPGLVADFRLRIPVSVLEQGLAHLLDTMSFMDAVPALRVKQWQVILLLLLDALSVSHIPALTDHMTNRRAFLTKVLDGAQIGLEEYETMKDLLIPLGRTPHFSAQSGA